MATENENTQVIIGCAIEVHKNLGPGLLESVYEESLCYELKQSNMTFKRQQQVPIKYKSAKLSAPLRLDLSVENQIIVEVKAKEETTPIDKQQLLTYLRLLDKQVGLIINFNVKRLVDGVTRVVNQFRESPEAFKL
ncbi:MAG: GxxExxY protein [Verrucomicrobiales bacterium]|nr:GxxExxY protein [Verrucomicrobiales bacterium]